MWHQNFNSAQLISHSFYSPAKPTNLSDSHTNTNYTEICGAWMKQDKFLWQNQEKAEERRRIKEQDDKNVQALI